MNERDVIRDICLLLLNLNYGDLSFQEKEIVDLLVRAGYLAVNVNQTVIMK